MPTRLTGVRWLQACLVLVAAVVGHDVLMASSGQHVGEIVAASTCESPETVGEHGDHRHNHHAPAITPVEGAPVAPPINCDEVRVVAPVKRALDEAPLEMVAIVPVATPALDLSIESTPIESDWQARDPHARRALWQVYRI
jgi:hypothetical protein